MTHYSTSSTPAQSCAGKSKRGSKPVCSTRVSCSRLKEARCKAGRFPPLLANVALHGMEELLVQRFPTKLHKCFYAPQVIRYADDLVVLHKDRAIIEQCQEVLAEWLQHMGLELKPSKTRITHTRNTPVSEPGFSFLGFNIRQYAVGKTQSGKDT